MSTLPLIHAASDDAPIACTLSAGAYRDRTAALSALAVRALTARATIDGGQRLTFVDSRSVERELRAAVAAEASCCSFLTMRLRRADGGLELEVTGPEQARPIIAELFA